MDISVLGATSERRRGSRGVRGVALAGVFFCVALALLCGVAWGAGLPDARQWELVSPPDKGGAQVEPLSEGEVQAAEGGEATTFFTSAPIDGETGPEGNTALVASPNLSVRSAAGWDPRPLTTGDASTTGVVLGLGGEYRMFSADLSLSVVEQLGYVEEPPLLAPDATERTDYLRADVPVAPGAGEAADYAAARSNGEVSQARGEVYGEPGYLPLLTAADTRPGVKFGTPCVFGTGICFSRFGVNNFLGGTPDLSHVVLRSFAGLTPGLGARGGEGNLFEWSQGVLQPVSVLPAGEQAGVPFPETEDQRSFETSDGSTLGGRGEENPRVVRHAISDDGSRIIWTDSTNEGEGTALYMRDMNSGRTVRLDQAESGVTEPEKGEAVFQTASADGSRVFFTDTQKLTSDSNAEPGKPDLYVCEIREEADGELACGLQDLTVPGKEHEGEPAQVQGLFAGGSNSGVVLGASEEGCDVGAVNECNVYFVARGVLSEGVNAEGHAPTSNEENLYLDRYGAGGWARPVFIATLSRGDKHDWKAINGLLEELTSRVSPNGQFLAFMSERSLTGYDNTDATSTVPCSEGGICDEEVYEYDAQSGRLVCASCDPSGEKPAGVFDPGGLKAALLVDRPDIWEGRWLAGSVPGWTRLTVSRSVYQSRYLEDDGRLFFDSPAGLVSGASNGLEDVYEFEPEGVGAEGARCTPQLNEADDVYKPEHKSLVEGVAGVEPAGCVGLISSGVSSEESGFLEASASGNDVFFVTAAQLVPGDFDHSFDVYDAHVCSEGPACFPEGAAVPPACTSGASCRAAPSPQPMIFGAPPSHTFSGEGNAPPAPAPKPVVKTAAQIRAERLAKALGVCRREKQRGKRTACEKRARKAYGPPVKPKKKAGKASVASAVGGGVR